MESIMYDEEIGKVLVYLDNSNIFINAQECSAKKKGFAITQDPRCRVDMGKLFSLAQDNRIVLQARLYGSEPPALDTVWDSIRKKHIHVSVSARSSWNDREKEIDTNLTADAVEDIIMYKEFADHKNSAVVIFSGDKDMLSTVRKAKSYKWNIEIWSFKKAICNDFVNDKQIKTFYIDNDEFFDRISFYAIAHRGRIPRDRSFVLSCKGLNTAKQKEMDNFANSIVRSCTDIFRLPMMFRFNKLNMILVVAVAQKRNDTVVYDFTKDVWNKTDILLEKIQQDFPWVSDIKFLPYVQFVQLNNDLCHEVDDPNFPDDEDFPVAHPDYPVDASFTTVARKTRKSNQKYSTVCVYGFRCQNAAKCSRCHTDKQKEYFKIEPVAAKRYVYKTKLCYHNICKFAKRAYLCSFAHSLQEARCVKCDEVGLHWTDECTSEEIPKK